ncbi:hypothetical protein OXX69_010879 [Metschnikowia pulcherrima]
MLKVDVTKRAFIEDVINDPFLLSIQYCHIVESKPAFLIGGDESKESLHDVDAYLQPANSSGNDSNAAETLVATTSNDNNVPSTSFVKASNHKHHLVTEKDLQKINEEKDRLKRAKEAGIA